MAAKTEIGCWESRPLTDLPGIGPGRATALSATLRADSLAAFVRILPLSWEEAAPERCLADLEDGVVSRVAVTVLRSSSWGFGRRKGVRVRIADHSAEADAFWYRQPWLTDAFPRGREVVLEGRASLKRGRQLHQPRVVKNEEDDEPLRAVYPEVAGMSSSLWRVAMRAALADAPPFEDPLPEKFRVSLDLLSLDEAVRALHFPDNADQREAARRRLAFAEILRLECARKRFAGSSLAPPSSASKDVWQRIRARLPHVPTDDQESVLQQLQKNLAQGRPLARLLHGEVGSGKTMVAFALALAIVTDKRQVALLVPTDILARQHETTLRAWLAGTSVQVVGLFGGDPPALRRAHRQSLADGVVQIAVGTHALLADSVSFADLGLVIFDEQHRFGVRQKAKLLAKGKHPHVLTMTATPIPRTLAWSRFGALDPLVLRARPGGGKVRTSLESPDSWPAWAAQLRPSLQQDARAFVVSSRIDGERGVLAEAQRLQEGPWRGLPLGVVHGRMSSAEIQSVVAAFQKGDLRALIGTTVVEVGLDVAGVEFMAVLGAERLGLASLHQLRGRLARGLGAPDGECRVFAADEAHPRLAILEAKADGFAVAEADLERRGPGALRGLRQHGSGGFLLFDPRRDEDLVVAMQSREARHWLDSEG